MESAFIRTWNTRLVNELVKNGYKPLETKAIPKETSCIATSSVHQIYAFIEEWEYDTNSHNSWNAVDKDGRHFRVDCGHDEELFIQLISIVKPQTPKQNCIDLIKLINKFNGSFFELADKLGGYNLDSTQFDFNFGNLCGTIYCYNKDIDTPYWLGDTFDIYDKNGQMLHQKYSIDQIMNMDWENF